MVLLHHMTKRSSDFISLDFIPLQAGPDALAANVVPMVIRAFEDPDARMQEEVLKRTLSLTKQLDFTVTILSLSSFTSLLLFLLLLA